MTVRILRRRRRRYQYRSYHLSRTACFAPALGLPLYGWIALGHPLDVPGAEAPWWHAAGLLVLLAAGLAVVPAVFVSLAAFAPDLPKMLVPRSWRASYRNRTNWRGERRRSRADQKSSYISTKLHRLVNIADRYQCVGCGAPGTDVDHCIPWSWGGLTVLWNCFTLCPNCNRNIKVDYWEDWRRRPHWGSHFNRANRHAASQIFRRERRRRWNPRRMIRLAWALGT